jgi:ribonuclease E
MSMRMLIDARHPEETRVAVVKGNRIEEFDFESAEHKQLKGNIYLAKVTRVEPSLQAAFVDYGGNRHGFLAFSEIHPDYYQIPKADREALLREEAEHAAEEERLRAAADDFEPIDDHHDDDGTDDRPEEGDDDVDAATATATATATTTEAGTGSNRSPVDESAADELRRKRQNLRRRYKIQDVIQRRQVLLVQVVKEERGNKGAALTTYLSLAGRYCVLMPNTSHGGGISRKISNGADRKRLKSIMSDLQLPSTMGLIVRTAGLSRTKTEIKRDFDYLARLWDEIRERTLKSSAPALIYRDSDLIKRAIRDLYHRDIDEVVVEGDEGYKAARGFMKLLMPSHVKRVKHHAETTPLFQRSGVEDQLNAMYQPVVQLKSGGYLVINPTEALVSIDINSGRSTREHNIEQTAFATNIEAAHEIARQLRLRDMAGLVVIDFIDMEQNSHVRKVEKAMKEALKNDRARIQVGRISSFGLMEMSRQRLRTGVLEASTKACPHCEGTGLMRTASSAGLSALRLIEDEAARGRGDRITLRAGREAAVYVLNKKRAELADIEARYGVSIEVVIDESFEGARMAVDVGGNRPVSTPRPAPVAIEDDEPEIDVADDTDDEDEAGEERVEISLSDDGDDERGGRRRRRRRRGGRGRGRRDGEHRARTDEQDGDDDQAVDTRDDESHAQPDDASADEQATDEKPARNRRRGGRKAKGDVEPTSSPMIETPADEEAPLPNAVAEAKPKRRRSTSKAKTTPVADTSGSGGEPDAAAAADETPAPKKRARTTAKSKAAKATTDSNPAKESGDASPEQASKPARKSRAKKAAEPGASDTPPPTAPHVREAANEADAGDDGGKPRSGWWQRTFG